MTISAFTRFSISLIFNTAADALRLILDGGECHPSGIERIERQLRMASAVQGEIQHTGLELEASEPSLLQTTNDTQKLNN